MSIRSFFVSRGRRSASDASSPAAAAAGRGAGAVVAAALEALEERRLFATFAATADTFVRDGGTFAGVNFGASDLLFTKNAAGDTRGRTKFDVAGAGTVGTAVLRFDACRARRRPTRGWGSSPSPRPGGSRATAPRPTPTATAPTPTTTPPAS